MVVVYNGAALTSYTDEMASLLIIATLSCNCEYASGEK